MAEEIDIQREALRRNRILRENELVYAMIALQDRREERLLEWAACADLPSDSPECRKALDAVLNADEDLKRMDDIAFSLSLIHI